MADLRPVPVKRLNKEEQKRVAVILSPSRQDQAPLVKRIANIDLRLRDLRRLRPNQLLNDELINAYMTVLTDPRQDDSQLDDPPLRTLAFSSYFYIELARGGHSKVASWTRGIDLFSYDYLFVPVHISTSPHRGVTHDEDSVDHWCLLVVNFVWRRIDYYDSLYDPVHAVDMDLVRRYLCDEWTSRKSSSDGTPDVAPDSPPLHPHQWKINETRLTGPQQDNGTDCGVFVCQIARALMYKIPVRSIKQCDMNYYRAQMLLQLIDY